MPPSNSTGKSPMRNSPSTWKIRRPSEALPGSIWASTPRSPSSRRTSRRSRKIPGKPPLRRPGIRCQRQDGEREGHSGRLDRSGDRHPPSHRLRGCHSRIHLHRPRTVVWENSPPGDCRRRLRFNGQEHIGIQGAPGLPRGHRGRYLHPQTCLRPLPLYVVGMGSVQRIRTEQHSLLQPSGAGTDQASLGMIPIHPWTS